MLELVGGGSIQIRDREAKVNAAATGDDAKLDTVFHVPTSGMTATAELAWQAVVIGAGGHVTHFGPEEWRLSVTRITARTPENCLLSVYLRLFLRPGCLALDRQEESRSLHICSRANGSDACCAP